MRVYSRTALGDVADLLAHAKADALRVSRSSSGTPSPGWSWEVADVTSAVQQAALPVEFHHRASIGEDLAAQVERLEPTAERDRVLDVLRSATGMAEIKLSLVEDWELLFAIVELVSTAGDGVTYCEGDPAGFFDDPRGEPILTL